MDAISVLALGNWGTALANHLASKGLDVLGWSIEPGIVESINTKHRNSTCFKDLELHPNLRATTDLSEALKREYIVLAFPSSVLKDLMHSLKVKPNTILISAMKGIESESLLTPLQYTRRELGPTVQLVVLSGPTFAIDIVHCKPSGIVAASENEDAAKKVAQIFSSAYMKVYLSSDPLGVELGGIAKNVIAIAVGVCDGLNFGDSARAGLITRGLAEIMRLAIALGANPLTLSGLSGLGDLIMTATCDTSRNRTVGLRLGRGETLNHIIKTLGSVAEGVKTAPLVLKLAEKHGVDMPITLQVTKLIEGSISIKDVATALLSRPTKREF